LTAGFRNGRITTVERKQVRLTKHNCVTMVYNVCLYLIGCEYICRIQGYDYFYGRMVFYLPFYIGKENGGIKTLANN
jgi:hypothetical protein